MFSLSKQFHPWPHTCPANNRASFASWHRVLMIANAILVRPEAFVEVVSEIFDRSPDVRMFKG
jgi:hypothetical protein